MQIPQLGYATFLQRFAAFFYDLLLYFAAFIIIGAIAMIFIVNDLPGPPVQISMPDQYFPESAQIESQQARFIGPKLLPQSSPKMNTLGWFKRTNPIYLFFTWILVPIAFFGWFWTRGGQTLSMRSWKIRIENLDGSNISWLQTILRLSPLLLTLIVCYILNINTLVTAICVGSICMLWSLIDKHGQGLNDLIAGTRMIKVESAYVPPKK